jgi:predicted Zn-dependent peptidase
MYSSFFRIVTRKKLLFLLSLSLVTLGLNGAGAQITRTPFPITEITLQNGLRVILSEDYSLPIVSVVVAYNVGSIHELPGKSGLAHLLENLMFQGSRNVGQMQHISFIQKIGGILNAVTKENRTLFYQTVPSNQLALVLWLESDRMNSLNINASNVEKIKNSLIEELQIRKDADPYLESSWYFDQLLFPSFTYSHPVLGAIPDIREITVEDVVNFYASFYTPNNAVISIVGNFNKNKVQQLVERYFSSIPRGNDLPSLNSEKLENIGNTVQSIVSPLATYPGFYVGYQIASPYSEDHYSLVMTEYILLKGQTSRLYKRLIEKDRTAIYLSGGIENKSEYSAFKINVRINNEIMRERSQKALFSEINKLKTNPVPEKELEKSKNIFKVSYFRQYATILDKAIFLAEKLLERDDLTAWPNELARYLSVTDIDILRTVNKYFTDDRIVLDIKIK